MVWVEESEGVVRSSCDVMKWSMVLHAHWVQVELVLVKEMGHLQNN